MQDMMQKVSLDDKFAMLSSQIAFDPFTFDYNSTESKDVAWEYVELIEGMLRHLGDIENIPLETITKWFP